MSSSGKTVSQEAILREWEEIQAAQREPRLFRPLYERYYESIFRFVFRRTADEALTADLCSQVFLKVLQKLPSYTFQGVPFSAWLYRIALNEVGQHYRQLQKNRVVSLETTQLHGVMEEVELDPEEALLLQEKMLTYLDDLKEVDMQIMELRFFEQRPYKEIATILEITENNAKVKVHRILERLKKKLSQDL